MPAKTVVSEPGQTTVDIRNCSLDPEAIANALREKFDSQGKNYTVRTSGGLLKVEFPTEGLKERGVARRYGQVTKAINEECERCRSLIRYSYISPACKKNISFFIDLRKSPQKHNDADAARIEDCLNRRRSFVKRAKAKGQLIHVQLHKPPVSLDQVLRALDSIVSGRPSSTTS